VGSSKYDENILRAVPLVKRGEDLVYMAHERGFIKVHVAPSRHWRYLACGTVPEFYRGREDQMLTAAVMLVNDPQLGGFETLYNSRF